MARPLELAVKPALQTSPSVLLATEPRNIQFPLRKRPLLWCYRRLAWPVWNHQHRRLVLYWSAGAGLDDTVIDALRTRRLDRLEVVEPTASELARQLHAELPVSRRHLRTVVDRYWDRDWRREHQSYDESPEDHLWRAAAAVCEIQDALEQLET